MRHAEAPVLVCACAALVLVSMGVLPFDAAAQARIERIDLERFPSVTLQVAISNPAGGGKPDIRSIGLTENGIPTSIEYFACPDDSIRLSIAILLDRSASMAQSGGNPDRDSTKLREARKAINAFLDGLGDRDEAALFTFATEEFTLRHIFTVAEDFTFDEWKLRDALAAVTARGGTRLWQAVIDAVQRLEGREGRRILMVVTDGRNRLGDSYRQPAIQAAKEAGIPVFSIGIGPDADIGALAGLAEATGGEFHFAPEASDLVAVLTALGGALLTDACVLRYVSGNPCHDGSRRDILVEFTGSGFQAQADSFYRVDSRLDRLTLRPGVTGDAFARDSLAIPVLLDEHISIKENLSYSIVIEYDANFMRFLRAGTVGTISSGADLAVAEPQPGLLQLSCASFLPALATGSLFDLHFFCFPSDSLARSRIRITSADVSGRCPAVVSVSSATWDIQPCEDSFRFGDSLAVTLPHDGTEGLLHLMLRGSLPAGAEARIVFRIDTDGLPFDILGVRTEGSMCEEGGVLMQQLSPGLHEFTALAIGGSDSLLFSLRIAAKRAGSAPLFAPLPLLPVDIVTGCAVRTETAGAGLWGTVVVDGICEPVLRLRKAVSLGNHPNPFVDGTQIRFRLPVDGPVVLQVMDGSGRRVRTLLEAPMRAGEYVFSFDGELLPAGEYYALLEHPGGVEVHRMMILR